VSGSLFSAATKIQPKGEALPFGLFGGVALLGFFLSFGIRNEDLEAEDWEERGTESDRERSPLLGSNRGDES
jgi:hypothetical protein